MTYNYNFDVKKYCCDTVVDKKAYNTNQSDRVEIWMDDIIKLANRWRVGKTEILL